MQESVFFRESVISFLRPWSRLASWASNDCEGLAFDKGTNVVALSKLHVRREENVVFIVDPWIVYVDLGRCARLVAGNYFFEVLCHGPLSHQMGRG